MKNKIRYKFFTLIELILNFKWSVIISFLILPILIVISFLILLEMRQSNLFFIIIFLLNYYIAVFILILIFSKAKKTYKARSPFYFIRGLNYGGDQSYQNNFKMKTKEKPLIGAEIGVASGKNAQRILNFLNIKQLILVDPWKVYSDAWQVDNTSPKRLDKFDDTFHENNYKKTVKNFSNNPKVKIIRDYSVNAAKMFDDKYFDFVYLDGDHSYEGVKKDLDSWYPKLKKFGVMCGDDYGNMHLPVIEAVSEFVYEHKLLVTCSEDKQFWFVKV